MWKSTLQLLALLLALLLVWLLAAPTRVEPVAWSAPPAPSLEYGLYANNGALKGIQRIAEGDAVGPETVVTDGTRLFTGLVDGRVASFAVGGSHYQLIANTGGRPLGIAHCPDGSLLVADAFKGLLRVRDNDSIETLSTSADGVALGFPDYVTLDSAGDAAYFSDATSKWHLGEEQLALLEHGGDGRLLRYDVATHQTSVLLHGLQFANGVALGPDETYVLVSETGAYRITRYWLKGEKAGTSDVFVDNLPGFPDNLTFNGRDRFWVAIPEPRDPVLDAFADNPFLRTMAARAIEFIPLPLPHRSMALAFDLHGQLVANLQYADSDAYAPITHVQEVGPWLYFGSLSAKGIGRLPLSAALPGMAP